MKSQNELENECNRRLHLQLAMQAQLKVPDLIPYRLCLLIIGSRLISLIVRRR